jgi:putative ABC transport system ATP-binding protein
VSSLEFDAAVKHYASGGQAIRAVDGVTLALGPGELVAIVGPSGSGKTTLLMLGAALVAPDAGSVCFDGRDLARMSPAEAAVYRRRELGFVFQFFHLMPSASALDNAALKLVADGWSVAEARSRARPWLERVGLGGRVRHRPGELSMGERQRVAIARALANEPRVVLADEPTGNLDSRRGREILGLMRDISHERGVPILLATHDPDAVAFADRVLHLRDGRLGEGVGTLADGPALSA